MSDLTEYNFDANKVDPSAGIDPIPENEYPAILTKSELKPTKDGTGKYLKCVFQVIDGEYKGRLVFEQITMSNPNAEATTIGKGQLSALCRAVGVMQPRNSEEMHNRPLIIAVKLERRKDDPTKFKNRVSQYKPLAGAAKAPVAGPGNATAASAQAPWARTA